MTGSHTLRQTEDAVSSKIEDLEVDFAAMAAVSNLYRAASSIRNHLEQSVLRSLDLTWTGFVVLWVVWIWDEIEARNVAAEAGITKGTLTGVARTLISRGLLTKQVPEHDRRRSLLSLTDEGQHLMQQLFPSFNGEEKFVTEALERDEVVALGDSLQRMIEHLEARGAERQASVPPVVVAGQSSRAAKRSAGGSSS
ncbi:MAG: MarR family winged helix-turn-helix transcriptional regulator [Aeromicrobium sp.]|uniref:MarR family winged helix-turn-helix transcriptional regulator n=1 Tax=Aeromicrobium sp. TaxID=1871063 RepID=UPI003C67A32A